MTYEECKRRVVCYRKRPNVKKSWSRSFCQRLAGVFVKRKQGHFIIEKKATCHHLAAVDVGAGGSVGNAKPSSVDRGRSVVQALWTGASRPQGVTVHSPSSAACPLLIPSHALSKAIRLTDEFEDVRAVSEPVQESSGEPFIAKDLCPIGKAQIGGEDEGHALVQLAAADPATARGSDRRAGL